MNTTRQFLKRKQMPPRKQKQKEKNNYELKGELVQRKQNFHVGTRVALLDAIFGGPRMIRAKDHRKAVGMIIVNQRVDPKKIVQVGTESAIALGPGRTNIGIVNPHTTAGEGTTMTVTQRALSESPQKVATDMRGEIEIEMVTRPERGPDQRQKARTSMSILLVMAGEGTRMTARSVESTHPKALRTVITRSGGGRDLNNQKIPVTLCRVGKPRSQGH